MATGVTMRGDEAVRPEADPRRPNLARIQDFLLGGKDNYQPDRALGQAMLVKYPELRSVVRANRAFLGAAVHELVTGGVRQFLDIGSGLLTVEDLPAIAWAVAPDSRYVFIDKDPIVVAHNRAMLTVPDDPRVAVLRGDLCRPEDLLAAVPERIGLDLDRPVAVLLGSVLQFVPETDRPRESLARLRDALAPGSHLVLTHPSADHLPERAELAYRRYAEVGVSVTLRSRDEVLSFFDGFELVDPGLVPCGTWRSALPGALGAAVAADGWVGVGKLP